MRNLVAEYLGNPGARRRLIAAGALGLLVWVTFFDSHSLLRRFRWQHEVHTLKRENAALEAEINALQRTLAAGLSRADIERIARTQYGMSRPGETVYPVAEGSSRGKTP